MDVPKELFFYGVRVDDQEPDYYEFQSSALAAINLALELTDDDISILLERVTMTEDEFAAVLECRRMR